MNGIVERALKCLGRGFDVTSDFRLKFCKGEDKLVLINGSETRDLSVPGFGIYKNISVDVKCDKGDRIRLQSDVLQFNQMSALFNQMNSLAGKVPSGYFNAMFGFDSGTMAKDASETKCLALDGYFISLFNLRLDHSPLILCDHVRNAVPNSWDPRALARFIEKYGTHIVTGLSVGGQDVVFVRQNQSSNLQPSELKKHLDKLGEQLFTGTCTLSPLRLKSKEYKNKVLPHAFNVFDHQPVLIDSFASLPVTKDGITVIWSKRGGDAMAQSHCEWLLTVPSMPDAINFTFIPITSLLKGVPGRGFLSHAINLYLRYKPPIADLEYFLDFQCPKMWAPIHSDLPLVRTNKATPSEALQFNLMGPKLYVNTAQVIVKRQPVTGMRLYLEGRKSNRLAIHLEHLSNIPAVLRDNNDGTLMWRGSDEIADERYFEPVQWKKFSHVCTAPVKYNPGWAHDPDTAFVVTGAQLQVLKYESKNVLHLRLLFSKVSSCGVYRSVWQQGPSDTSQKFSLLSAISTSITGFSDKEKQPPIVIVDSGVFPTGPPMPVQAQKHLKFVDTSHVCKGAQDSPGHWLVSGAKLDLVKGKICVHVKFSLLNFSSTCK